MKGVNMILPKLILRRMSVELKQKPDEYLKELLKHYEIRLSNLDDEDYKRYSKSIKQKINVVKKEMHYRTVLNSSELQN